MSWFQPWAGLIVVCMIGVMQLYSKKSRAGEGRMSRPDPCPRCGSRDFTIRWKMIDIVSGRARRGRIACAGCGMRRGAGVRETAPALPEADAPAHATLAALRAAREQVRGQEPVSAPVEIMPPAKSDPEPQVAYVYIPRPQPEVRSPLWDRELDG